MLYRLCADAQFIQVSVEGLGSRDREAIASASVRAYKVRHTLQAFHIFVFTLNPLLLHWTCKALSARQKNKNVGSCLSGQTLNTSFQSDLACKNRHSKHDSWIAIQEQTNWMKLVELQLKFTTQICNTNLRFIASF